jgi:hypothetical protein
MLQHHNNGGDESKMVCVVFRVPPLASKGGTESGLRLPARGCGQGTCTVHERTPFSDFSIFSPMHIFFSIFLYKIGVYDPDFAYTIKPKTLQSTLNPILKPIS